MYCGTECTRDCTIAMPHNKAVGEVSRSLAMCAVKSFLLRISCRKKVLFRCRFKSALDHNMGELGTDIQSTNGDQYMGTEAVRIRCKNIANTTKSEYSLYMGELGRDWRAAVAPMHDASGMEATVVPEDKDVVDTTPRSPVVMN